MQNSPQQAINEIRKNGRQISIDIVHGNPESLMGKKLGIILLAKKFFFNSRCTQKLQGVS